MEARKPTRPKLAPITGTPLPSRCASVRRIVPSPPSATARSASRGSSTTFTPTVSATWRTRSTASFTSTRPCATIATELTGCDCCCDSLVEVIGKGRVVRLHEMEEELPVPFRAGKSGVYDAEDARPPAERSVRDFAQHARPRLGLAHDASLPDVRPPRLELRLHEHDGLPARCSESQDGRQRDAHGDERD